MDEVVLLRSFLLCGPGAAACARAAPRFVNPFGLSGPSHDRFLPPCPCLLAHYFVELLILFQAPRSDSSLRSTLALALPSSPSIFCFHTCRCCLYVSPLSSLADRAIALSSLLWRWQLRAGLFIAAWVILHPRAFLPKSMRHTRHGCGPMQHVSLQCPCCGRPVSLLSDASITSAQCSSSCRRCSGG